MSVDARNTELIAALFHALRAAGPRMRESLAQCATRSSLLLGDLESALQRARSHVDDIEDALADVEDEDLRDELDSVLASACARRDSLEDSTTRLRQAHATFELHYVRMQHLAGHRSDAAASFLSSKLEALAEIRRVRPPFEPSAVSGASGGSSSRAASTGGGASETAVFGFDAAPQMDVDDVTATLRALVPAEHRSRRVTKSIRYLPRPTTLPPNVLGQYLPSPADEPPPPGWIEVYPHSPASTRDDMLHTILHEIGHGVHRYVLSDAARLQWHALHHRRVAEAPTAYASTNERESFAESYALHLLAPDWLRAMSPARAAFLEDHVFPRVERQ